MKRIILFVAAVAALIALVPGCDGGREGDRCNPDLSHNDCNSGLTCITPSTCVESYCCPSDPQTSSNPYCNGNGCPAVDSGASEDSGTGSSDANEASADASASDARGD